MRKVDVVRPPINYVVVQTTGLLKGEQIEAGNVKED